MRDALLRAAAFVLSAAVVVAASIVAPPLADRPDGPAEYPEYGVSELVPVRAESGGVPAVDRAPSRGVVLIDAAHDNRYEPAEIQPLLAAITATGYGIRWLRPGDAIAPALSHADAFVVIDPGRRYRPAEVDRVEAFVEAGGRVALLGEPTRGRLNATGPNASVRIARNRLGSLASRFGIGFGTGYLYNMRTNDGNFRNVVAGTVGDRGLSAGVNRTVVYTATSVDVREGRRVLVAAAGTRTARGDRAGRHAVAVRAGNVVAVGDTSFVEGESYGVMDNDRFLANLVSFVVGGDRERTLLDYPYNVAPDPIVRYTEVGLLDAARAIGNDLDDRGAGEPRVLLARGAVPTGRTDVLVTTYGYLETHDLPGVDLKIRAGGGRVRVPGYESNAEGVIVVRAPTRGIDLVVAADDPRRARRAATLLVGGRMANEFAITDRTAVVRTPASVPERVVVVPRGNATAPGRADPRPLDAPRPTGRSP